MQRPPHASIILEKSPTIPGLYTATATICIEGRPEPLQIRVSEGTRIEALGGLCRHLAGMTRGVSMTAGKDPRGLAILRAVSWAQEDAREAHAALMRRLATKEEIGRRVRRLEALEAEAATGG
jgi:hypothetical protein